MDGKITIRGVGDMDTAVALQLAGNGQNVLAREYFKEVVSEGSKKSTNSSYLPDIKFSDDIKATKDWEDATKDGKNVKKTLY